MLKTHISNNFVHTARNVFVIDVLSVKKSTDPDQSLRQRRGGWSGTRLHFLHMS